MFIVKALLDKKLKVQSVYVDLGFVLIPKIIQLFKLL